MNNGPLTEEEKREAREQNAWYLEQVRAEKKRRDDARIQRIKREGTRAKRDKNHLKE